MNTQMNKLHSLYTKLNLPDTQLIILDEFTGAGYIEIAEINVFARWGSYEEGIAVLSQYVAVSKKPNY